MAEAFVYRWRDTLSRGWYIGYHKGTADDGYLCSSRTVKPQIQQDPDRWQRRILRWGTKQEMAALERRLLKRLQARTNPRSYNFHNGLGVPAGVPSRADVLGYDLNTMTADQIAQHYQQEILTGQLDRRVLVEQWILNKTFWISRNSNQKPA